MGEVEALADTAAPPASSTSAAPAIAAVRVFQVVSMICSFIAVADEVTRRFPLTRVNLDDVKRLRDCV
jgi:hypothetical protein